MESKQITFITLRLVNFYERTNERNEAFKILKEAIEASPNDKDLNLRYGLLLSEESKPDLIEIKHFLRKSFTLGDTRYEAQFWYARCLYLLNDIPGSKAIFDILKDAKVDSVFRREPRGEIKEVGNVKIFEGVITSLEASYGFIKRNEFGDSLFFFKHKENLLRWDSFKKYKPVKFKIKFNYKGAVAVDVS